MASAEEKSDDETIKPRTRLRSNSYEKAVCSETPIENDFSVNPTFTIESERKLMENQPIENDNYLIKWIHFNYEQLPILLQNRNGPCPLLALANVLLLRKKITFDANLKSINNEQLITFIANCLLQTDSNKFSKQNQMDYEHNLSDALSILPNLQSGMNVNVKFTSVDQFEYTPECLIFDILRIELYHGWVIDPQDNILQKLIGPNAWTYNQLIEKMLLQQKSTDDNLLQESLLIEQFLEENRSQFTHYGLLQLNEKMPENQLAVLFRNNHFSTIWKTGNKLLLLVSDQGYLHHPSIVFETLTDISNDSIFTDGHGKLWKYPSTINPSQDYSLAVQLHNQEQRQYFEAQQQKYDQRYLKHSKRSKEKTRGRSNYDDDDHRDTGSTCSLS